jgi:hypothetical protein
MSARSPFGVLSNGAVVMEDYNCCCAFPGEGDQSYHEEYCGLEVIGFLPEEAAAMHGFDPYPEPSLLPAMLWDFGGAL